MNELARLVPLCLAAAFLWLASPLAVAAPMRVEAERQPAMSTNAVMKAKRANPARVPQVRLEPMPPPELAKASAPAARMGKPMQIGVGRNVDSLKTASSMAQRMTWEGLAGGRTVGSIAITSPGASALRAGMRIGAVPHDAVLRFYAPHSGEVFEVTAAEVRETLSRNLYFDEDTSEARTFWSPIVEGPEIVIEIELPAGASPQDVRITSPIVSHMVTSAATHFAMPKAAASCSVDAMCYQGAWSAEMDAVARIVYTVGGSSFVCSGTLIADRERASAVPYFLTANHCVHSQTTASTIQSYWFYRSSACNSGVRGDYRTVFGGATLLYATDTTDTAFMRLNSAPPAGAVYAGWLVGPMPPQGAGVTGIHHPTGDLQKINFGNVEGSYSCGPFGGDGGFRCGGETAAASTFHGVRWQGGITESGSSGSALFTNEGHYLLGQLYGGSGDCTTPGLDFYGRFDVAYNTALYQWLGGTPQSPSQPSNLPTQNYSDLWWNAGESGWGLSVTQHDAMIFAAWYIYDDAGRPSWVVMPGGRWTAATTFTGDLYMASGPDPRGAFDPARVVRTRVGAGTLSFDTPERALWSYQLNGSTGSKQIQRQPFGVPDNTPVANYSDLWWNATESGWGVSISQQYRTIFAVWYAYANGQPTWYVLPGGAWLAPDTYSGTLYRTSAAPGSLSAFNAGSVVRSAVGSLTLKFTSLNTATMSYSVDGTSGTKAISRQPF